MTVGGFGISPSEYWGMTPAELNVLIESKRPKELGGIHEDDIAKMLERRAALEALGMEVL